MRPRKRKGWSKGGVGSQKKHLFGPCVFRVRFKLVRICRPGSSIVGGGHKSPCQPWSDLLTVEYSHSQGVELVLKDVKLIGTGEIERVVDAKKSSVHLFYF